MKSELFMLVILAKIEAYSQAQLDVLVRLSCQIQGLPDEAHPEVYQKMIDDVHLAERERIVELANIFREMIATPEPESVDQKPKAFDELVKLFVSQMPPLS
jgi:hypothetical protein